MFKKISIISLIIIIMVSCIACGKTGTDATNNDSTNINKPVITVAIPPVKAFTEWIGGDTIKVVSIIPPGSSPANYQLEASQIKDLTESSLYFSIGVPAEKASILDQVSDNAKNAEIVYLDELVSQKFNVRYFDENNEGSKDPHIWLSPNRVSYMIEVICTELSKIYPENKDLYESNLEEYKEKLEDLDTNLKAEIENMQSKNFIIFHPAYGYFADDYNLNMVALEEDGKEASPQRFTEVIDFAKQENIKLVFYQAEMDSSQAKTLADEIDGEAEMLEPLSEDYFDSFDKLLSLLKEVNNRVD